MEQRPHKPATERPEPADSIATAFEAERADIARLCHRLLDDPVAVEDAASEIYLRARRALSSYDPEQPFRPWLRAVASNYCIDQLRRRRTEHQIFSQAELADDRAPDTSPGALQCLTRKEERREVLAAIDTLPAKYRIPLVLRFYRDLDYETIAELLGITRNQVGSLLFRAKTQLRERLSGVAESLGEPKVSARRRGRARPPKASTRTQRTEKR